MFQTIRNVRPGRFLYARRLLSLSLLTLFLGEARADIITDIEQLDKPKEKKEEKKLEEKKEKAPKKEPKLEIPEELAPPPNGGQSPQIFPPTESSSKTPKLSKEQRRNAPIHLQSDGTTTYSKNRMMVHMEKNVLITQDDMRLQANEATVHFEESKGEGNGVKDALLNGNVSMSRNPRDPAERMNARSQKAIFDNNAQTVVLEGNARLWREGNLIKGEKITYEITTGMIKVDRAQGVVQPDKVKQP